MTKTNIFIVDDHYMVIEGIRSLLQSETHIEWMGHAMNAASCMAFLQKHQPDIILMDINLPGKDGIKTVAQMKPVKPRVQYLMCTSYEEPEKTFESLCAGATGYLLKNSSSETLFSSVKDIYKGGSPMSPQIARLVVTSFNQKQKASEEYNALTEREKEILAELVNGKSYKMIAEAIGITFQTVKTHLKNIYDKLHVHSQSEAVAKAIKDRLV